MADPNGPHPPVGGRHAAGSAGKRCPAERARRRPQSAAGDAAAPAPSPDRHQQPRDPGGQGPIHRRLLERLNLSNLDKLEREQVVDAIRRVTHDLLTQDRCRSTSRSGSCWSSQVLDEIFGLGPLEPLIQDPEISDILVNTSRACTSSATASWSGPTCGSRTTGTCSRSSTGSSRPVGRRIDDSSPMVDARLPDGSRVNAIIKPLAHRRPAPVDPQVQARRADRRGPAAHGEPHRADARVARAASCGPGSTC